MTPEPPCCLSLLSQTAQAVLGVTDVLRGPSRSRLFGKGDLEFTFEIPLTDLSYKVHFASLGDPDAILDTFFRNAAITNLNLSSWSLVYSGSFLFL